jgi:hypothetical protein
MIIPKMEARAAADPYATTATADWRRRLLAEDSGGHLRRAETAARRAVAAARTPEEKHEALLWLSIIECGRGRHAAELEHVRRLAAMRPGDPTSLGALRRAAKCNGLWELAAQADEALEEKVSVDPTWARNRFRRPESPRGISPSESFWHDEP